MIKVLTACGNRHKEFIDSCLSSTNNMDCVHILSIDEFDEGKGVVMNRMLSGVKDDDIVALLDADDTACEGWLDNVKYLKDYDLVYGNTLNYSPTTRELYRSRDFDKELFLKYNFIPYSGVIMKGWLAKQAPYPNIVHGADYYWWHLLLQYSDKFKYVDKIFCTRRTHTSYRSCNIPVYRKLRRLYREYKLHKMIDSI